MSTTEATTTTLKNSDALCVYIKGRKWTPRRLDDVFYMLDGDRRFSVKQYVSASGSLAALRVVTTVWAWNDFVIDMRDCACDCAEGLKTTFDA